MMLDASLFESSMIRDTIGSQCTQFVIGTSTTRNNSSERQ